MNGTNEFRSPLGTIDKQPFFPGKSIQHHFDLLPVVDRPVVAVLNGEPILRESWDTNLTVMDNISFVLMPEGGGFKGILRIVAMIALVAAAPWAGGVIAGSLGWGAVGAGLITGGLVMAGSFLLNILLPPELPSLGNTSRQEASPTYSLSGSGNSARLMQPIPKLYGRHIIYPDYAALPWSIYEGNEQYLYQLFCLGLGHYSVEEIRIGDTSLWKENGGLTGVFSDVEVQIVAPGEKVKVFPGAVETATEVSGQNLTHVDTGVILRRNETNPRRIEIINNRETIQNLVSGDEIDIEGGFISGPNTQRFTVLQVGPGGQWLTLTTDHGLRDGQLILRMRSFSWVGPFAVVSAGRRTDKITCDFSCPNGLYHMNDKGNMEFREINVTIEARRIDDDGNPIGNFSEIATFYMRRKTSTPQRGTKTINVPLARYQVRVRRTTADETDTRTQDTLSWDALRGFIPDDNVYQDVTLLAVKMRATNQLSQDASRQFNVIQTSRLPQYWNGSWGELTKTQNPAWIAADILRNPVYGAGVSDDRIDMPALLKLAGIWRDRGDNFNGVLDSKQSLWATLQQVLKVGRTQPLLLAGKVTFMRDEPKPIIRGLFTEDNIVTNSLEITHILHSEDSPDSVIVEYMDERTWQMNEVLCSLADATDENPARIQIFGATNRQHAWREGMYQAAVNSYRRVFSTFGTELEGRLLLRGDAIALSHDLPKWGRSGVVVEFDPSSRRVTLDQEYPQNSLDYLGFNDATNKLWGPVVVLSNVGNTAVLQQSSFNQTVTNMGPCPIHDEFDEMEPTRYLIGSRETIQNRFKVSSVTPKGAQDLTVEVTVTNDDPRVYTADVGTAPPDSFYEGVGTIEDAPKIRRLDVTLDPEAEGETFLSASWSVAPGAQKYVLQISYDDENYATVYEGEDPSADFKVSSQTLYIRVAAINRVRGPWTHTEPRLKEFNPEWFVPTTPQNFTASMQARTKTIVASWDASRFTTKYGVRLLSLDDQGAVSRIYKISTTTHIEFSEQEIKFAGGPWRTFAIELEPMNANYSGEKQSFQVGEYTLEPPLNLQKVGNYTGRSASAQWNEVAGANGYRVVAFTGEQILAEFITNRPGITLGYDELMQMNYIRRYFQINVTAFNDFAESVPANVQFADPPIDAPTGLSGSVQGGNIQLSWNAVPEAIRYSIHVGTSSDFTPDEDNKATTDTKATSKSFSMPDGTHFFKVVSYDNFAGDGPFLASNAVRIVK